MALRLFPTPLTPTPVADALARPPVLQWRDHVLQYKHLKRAIRQALAARDAGTATADQLLSGFTQLLDHEVSRVNNFYMDRIEEGVIILHALRQQGDGVLAAAAVQSGLSLAEQRHACKQSLVTFHLNLLVLQNYVALNFMAIAKILKKWDKQTQLPLRTEYISAIVELPFYQCQALGQLVEDAESLFAVLDKQSATTARAQCVNECSAQETATRGQLSSKEQWQQANQQPTHTIS